MHHLAGLDGVEGALILEWWLISVACQDSCGTHDRHPTWLLKCLNFGRWPDTPRPNTSSLRQLKQESAREWRQRPAAHRSQQSVDGVVVLSGRRGNVWRHTAEACAREAIHCNAETQQKYVAKLWQMAGVGSVLSSPRPGMLSLLPKRRCHLIQTESENSVQIQGVIVSRSPETKVKQKSSREVSLIIVLSRNKGVHLSHRYILTPSSG